MKISKIKIENLFGIEELETDGKSKEFIGTNGVGKSSVLDAIRLALTNNSKRKYIIKNGEEEGRILVQLDNGVTIDRKKRLNKSDYKSIKNENGEEIKSPETFLKDIFTPLQLEPVEFLDMNEQEQNRILLNLIEFNQDKKTYINEKFGETPSWVDYDFSILEILNQIQSKDGEYYQKREDINRDIRNKNAIIQNIAKDIPDNYDYNKWKEYSLSSQYELLNKQKDYNDKISRSITYKENYNNTIERYKAELSSKLSEIFVKKSQERDSINKKIEELKSQIISYEKDLENLDNKYDIENTKVQSEYNEKVAKLDENINIANEWASKEKQNTQILEDELKTAEQMKGLLNSYEKIVYLNQEVDNLNKMSKSLTDKIELARKLPGEILKEAKLPIENLTVVDGIPLINGLPINNLSEGQKLMLCVDVALSKPNTLQLILIDGVERLSEKNREELYKICKAKGLDIIATRTTNDDELNIIEL